MAYDDEIISTLVLKGKDETGDVLRGMSERIKETTSSFARLGTSILSAEGLRRSFDSYAELTRTLERLQFATKVTDEQMVSLGETLDDVSKRTGRTNDETVKAFQQFYQMTGQQYGPALESMFKTIGEASQVTGASLESLSRIAGAAVNNMKVPQEEMDELIKKLAVDLPGALEEFSQVVPRVTQSMNTIGLTGAKNAEEAALAFATLNRAFGNVRLSASALNELMTQLSDGSSTFGKMMIPQLMEIRRHGGDVTDTFEAMYQKLNQMHAFDPNVPPSITKILGLDFNTLKAIKALHDGLDQTKEKLKESEEASKTFGERLNVAGNDAKASVDALLGSVENLTIAIGALLDKAGASDLLKKFSTEAASFTRVLNEVSKGHYYKAAIEAMRDVDTPMPKEDEPEPPRQPSSSILSPGRYMLNNNIMRDLLKSFEPKKKMARGGIVTNPTVAEIGEAGPEAVIPLGNSPGNLGGGISGNGKKTEDNTAATEENTTAITKLSSYMRDHNDRGIYMNAAFTPGAGDTPTAKEAGLYGGADGYGGRNGGAYPASIANETKHYNDYRRDTMERNLSGARGGGIPSEAAMNAKDKAWMGGDRYSSHHSRGGEAGPGNDGTTSPPSGNLATQRSGFMKELNDDPHLKAFAVDAMRHEGGVQSNLEQLFNYAAMRKMTIRQALHSGQYGPVNRGLISGNRGISTSDRTALEKVGAGSNITNYATDQGMAGDPNFAKYMANREHYGMHKVEGAWFSAHGEPGVKWAQRQRAIDQAAQSSAAAKAEPDTQTVMKINGHDFPMGRGTPQQPSGESVFDKGTSPVSHLENHRAMREEMERPIRMSVEAPTPPPLYSYRQRMARQQSRYQADDQLGAPRYASQMDIGFA